ncbi:MAG: GTPase HflX [Candidatus Hydrogenedentes bacterium]|nr:GTPase HflX [Candidatus Hydrogenedentota bacterium]
MIDLERPPVVESAILVRLALPSDSDDEIEESLEEMRRLAWTAGAEVLCTVVQYRPDVCPATLIGPGKVKEIRASCEELEADVVLVDSDLTPTQGSKLQEALGVKVLDRTQLILDIFAQRAQTNEGKHQVELAQLQYALPRLTGRGAEMMRLGAGIGTRGPGEQKLEVDRRVIRKRINRLKAELDEIRKHRRLQRKCRTEGSVGTVALVGYTNAGKSSLLNALTESHTHVEDKLFATLDPCSRRCPLPNGGQVIITDTVGFIRKLPHSLVAAFRATLEEVNEADLILLVADVSHEMVTEHIDAVNAVLDEIKVENKPIIRVFNKIDVADPALVRAQLHGPGNCVSLSAKTGEGIEELLKRIEDTLSVRRVRVRLRIPQREAGVAARVYQEGRVLDRCYEDNSILLDAEIDAALAGQMDAYVERTEPVALPLGAACVQHA